MLTPNRSFASRLMVPFATLLVVGLFLVACGGQLTSQGEEKILRIAPEAGLATLDPNSYLAIIDNIVGSQLYDNLIQIDENNQLQPGLATSWKQIDEDTWELKLREGVEFHDGTPFNSEAAVFSVERAIDPDRASRSRIFAPFIKGATAVDEFTIRVDTIGQVPYAPIILSYSNMAMLSPSAVEEFGEDYARNPVGTGPFRFVEWQQDEFVKMEAYDQYWAGRPNLDGLEWRLIPSESARFVALEAGEVDLIANPPTELIPQIEGNEDLKIVRSTTGRVVGVWINPAGPPLDTVEVRKAIFYATDGESIMKNIIRGLASPAHQYLEPSVFGSLPDDEIPEGGFYPFDPDRSRELLEVAGWTDSDGDGMVDKDGQNLTVTVQTAEGRYLKDREIAEATTAFLRDVGIDANLLVVEFPTHSADVTQHNLEVFILGWGWSVYPEPTFYAVFHSSDDGGPAAWAQWSNPEADALMEAALTEPDDERRRELYQEIQLIALDEAVILPIYFKDNFWVTRESVSGLSFFANEEPAKMVDTDMEG